jgi:hypothetical protein
MLIAACIAGASLIALLPLYVSSCRTILAAAERVSLSDRVTALTGADDFERVLQLVRLCPELGTDREGIRAVRVYYQALRIVASLLGNLFPRLNSWSEFERRQCAHFAAVVLDRSISSSRKLFTLQASDQL